MSVRHRQGSKWMLLIAGLAMGAGLSACGGDDVGEERAAAAVRDLQRSFATRDLASVCARMTPIAKRQAGLMAHGRVNDCRRDLREALRVVGQGGWGPPGQIADMAIDGDRATATLETDEDRRVEVGLLIAPDGNWRLDSFFGTPRAIAKGYEADMRTIGAPAPASEDGVRASDDFGPCLDTIEDHFPEIAGGCELTVSGQVTVEIDTVFGGFEFGRCTLEYRVVLDGSGTAWTDPIQFDSPTPSGCADLSPCRKPSGVRGWPWRGRVVADDSGGFVHRMNACLDTCVGFFTGELTTRLVEVSRGRWRVEARPSGTTGFRMTGNLEATTPPAFKLAPT